MDIAKTKSAAIRSMSMESLPKPPRFFEHPELHDSREQLSWKRVVDDRTANNVTGNDQLKLFKYLNLCGLKMHQQWSGLHRGSARKKQQYLEIYEQYMSLRERLVEINIGLVFSLLGKCRFKNVEHDELRSEGLMALVRAMDTFNPWRGYQFSTYASNSILRSFSRLALLQSKRRNVWSTNLEPGFEQPDVNGQRKSNDQQLLQERLTAMMEDNRARLNEIERFIISQRYPLEDQAERSTLKSIGQRLQMSKERVRQIQESALSKLARALREDPVLDFA